MQVWAQTMTITQAKHTCTATCSTSGNNCPESHTLGMLLLCQNHLNAIDNLQLAFRVSAHTFLEHFTSFLKQVFTVDSRVTFPYSKDIVIER